MSVLFLFFFFQAEDGIRYPLVTGVQTCALPICPRLGNTGRAPDLAMLQQLVVHAVRAGREHMRAVRDDRDAALTERVQRHERRLRSWQRHAEQLTLKMAAMPQRRHREKEVAAVAADTEGLIADQRTSGNSLVRVVAVLVGER